MHGQDQLSRVVLVGESNPYGADPRYALYPAPDGCSGQRLCCLILGMRRHAYLSVFERTNLCGRKWSVRESRRAAAALIPGRVILCGSKVSAAFGVEFEPFKHCFGKAGEFLILPHPSGRCRFWSEPGAIERARQAVRAFCPELAPLIGVAE